MTDAMNSIVLPRFNRIEERNPDEDRRFEEMRVFVSKRTCLCLCQLIFEFHVRKDRVYKYLTEEQEEFVGVPSPLPNNLDHDEPACSLYVSNSRPLDPAEFREVAGNIDFAVGVLKTCFPGYKANVPLKDQDEVGRQVDRALGASVRILHELEVVPKYWKGVRFNATAIVLSLRQVLEDPAEPANRTLVEAFLREAAEYDETIRVALCGLRQDAGVLVESMKKTTAALDATNRRLDTTNRRLARILAPH